MVALPERQHARVLIASLSCVLPERQHARVLIIASLSCVLLPTDRAAGCELSWQAAAVVVCDLFIGRAVELCKPLPPSSTARIHQLRSRECGWTHHLLPAEKELRPQRTSQRLSTFSCSTTRIAGQVRCCVVNVDALATPHLPAHGAPAHPSFSADPFSRCNAFPNRPLFNTRVTRRPQL